ncbi:MAG TPA: trypsin-like peptidase domain-containing protein [Candidatus Dojkabacteria bacterium]|nr:trypsin-like peptidase domain-containing protein [Candidatus Dojkabacteria bacterium]
MEEKKVNKKEKVEAKKVLKQDGAKFVLFGALIIFGLLIVLASVIFVLYERNTAKIVVEKEGKESKEQIELVVTEDEKNTIEIVRNSEESVVSIAVSQLSLTQEEGVRDINNNIGTGFIVDNSGIVITNQHVVSDEKADYKVIDSKGEEFEIMQILRDSSSDIALIRIDIAGREIKALELGDSDKLVVGQSVIAIGTPLGEYAGSVTAGIVSGLNRSLSAGKGWFGTTVKTYEGVIQTDAAINPGNSGGPLIDSQGKVIGVNFATASGVDNISFALPINKVKNRLEEYRTHGKFIMPYLGVSYQMVSTIEALYYKDVVPGALVVRIDPISPAYEAGIRRGDFITEFGDEKVVTSLADMIQKHKVGEEVNVKVYRAGKDIEMKVKLGEME